MTTPGLAAAGLLVALVLTGCSQAEDIATDTAGDAACALAQRTLDEVLAQTQGAVDELGVDPAAAERRLIALRDTAQAAGAGLSGESRARVDEARVALDDLVQVAEQGAAGGPVDQAEVQRAREDLDDAVTGLTGVC